MQILQVALQLAIFGGGLFDESLVADALMPEHLRTVVAKLDDPSFQQREAATEELVSIGAAAVYPLTIAAETGSAEASVRAFDILQRLYRGDHEPTFEAVELAYQQFKHSGNVAVAARALRDLENNCETRQERAVTQFERMGGIVSFRNIGVDRQPLSRAVIEYVALTRNWTGGEKGLQLLNRIEDIRSSETPLYIIRGVQISRESVQNLRAELPFMQIQFRGPARLGVRSNPFQRDDDGCVISEVDPGSAAERAGLKANDQIVNINGFPVSNFQDLIQIIETREPGDSVKVVFRRGSITQEVSAELLTWSKQVRPNLAPLQRFGQPALVPEPKSREPINNIAQPKPTPRRP